MNTYFKASKNPAQAIEKVAYAGHSALLVEGNKYTTLHKKDAEEMGLQLVYKDSQPFYYVKP